MSMLESKENYLISGIKFKGSDLAVFVNHQILICLREPEILDAFL